ncbi:MAG: hypothetical protein ACI80V_000051 [Rhodothermales bacterium]|jgi:hypothetical protein
MRCYGASWDKVTFNWKSCRTAGCQLKKGSLERLPLCDLEVCAQPAGVYSGLCFRRQ